MARNTGTIFKVYLLAKSDPNLEEGFLQLWKHKGKFVRAKLEPFNRLDRIGVAARRLLKRKKIKWP